MGVGYSPGGQEGGFNMVGGGLIGGGGMDGGLYGSNAQVTVRLLVPLAAGKLLVLSIAAFSLFILMLKKDTIEKSCATHRVLLIVLVYRMIRGIQAYI